MATPSTVWRRRRRTRSRWFLPFGRALSLTMIAQLVALLEWVAVMSDTTSRTVHGWVQPSTSWASRGQWHLPPAATAPRQQPLPFRTQSGSSRGSCRVRSLLTRHASRKKKGGPIGGGDVGGGRAGDFLDVEFERVVKGVPKGPSSGDVASNLPIYPSVEGTSAKSWIEWSLEADPELNSTRIPFFGFRRPTTSDHDEEQDGADFIDVRLSFLVELDGETYGIGTPFDHAVALTMETTDKAGAGDSSSSTAPAGSVENLPPTSDNEELMEIMATQLHESVGSDLQLVRTPRVLTVRGPLERYTDNWRNELLPEPLTASQLLDETDEDVEDFLSFMRRELGDQEVEKTLRGESALSADEAELVKLFNIPGLGDQADDGEGINDLLETLLESPQEQNEQFQKMDPIGQSAAIKLFSFIMPDSGKVYSLVRLLQPFVLVAKRASVPSSHGDGDREVRFELLPSAEEQLLIPRLEQVCKADLERAGLQLRAAAQETTPSVLEP